MKAAITPMDDQIPQIRNSVTVESPYGLRSFTLRLGDISGSSDSVLVVSTHANSAFEPTGDVIDAVEACSDVDFASREPLHVPRTGFGI